ncbi:hypothetical protein [Cryobacterium sp. Y82]|uniref:hypothetical protein n=2 Tax=Cryobacterium TaxID=69578 RepID=UPI0011B06B82|nr:hypothetical protein [Cryobacterium sp. Y82]
MDLDLSIALLAGGFALAGGVGGALLTGLLGRGAERRRLTAEDERRWLADRRTAYAKFLAMSVSLHMEIDTIGIFLPTESRPISADDELILADLYEYTRMWETSLQPLLGEVELLASPEVVDLADRVSGALLAVTAPIELRLNFDDYYPVWFQTRDLIHVLRDAMRTELGLPKILKVLAPFPREDDWPWLDSRPPVDSYIQGKRPKAQ